MSTIANGSHLRTRSVFRRLPRSPRRSAVAVYPSTEFVKVGHSGILSNVAERAGLDVIMERDAQARSGASTTCSKSLPSHLGHRLSGVPRSGISSPSLVVRAEQKFPHSAHRSTRLFASPSLEPASTGLTSVIAGKIRNRQLVFGLAHRKKHSLGRGYLRTLTPVETSYSTSTARACSVSQPALASCHRIRLMSPMPICHELFGVKFCPPIDFTPIVHEEIFCLTSV